MLFLIVDVHFLVLYVVLVLVVLVVFIFDQRRLSCRLTLHHIGRQNEDGVLIHGRVTMTLGGERSDILNLSGKTFHVCISHSKLLIV